jgi:hypothetical protein
VRVVVAILDHFHFATEEPPAEFLNKQTAASANAVVQAGPAAERTLSSLPLPQRIHIAVTKKVRKCVCLCACVPVCVSL